MNKVLKIKASRRMVGCLLAFLFAMCLKADAQFDIGLTQYMNNEMFVNPAYAGTRRVLATTLAYRNQWAGMQGAPVTETFSAHSPTGKKAGLGVSIMNESIGISRRLQFNGNYSYRIKTGTKGYLSFGVSGGLIQYSQDFNKLLLNNNNDHLFSANYPSVIAPNAGFGMFFYTNKFYLGFSIPRLMKNTIESYGLKNSASVQDWHYYLTSAVVLKASDDFTFKPSIMIKEVYGAPLQAEVALHGLVCNVWWIGLSYRSSAAVSATTGFQLSPQFRIFYSYDYALTKLQTYSTGSHEIVLSYDFAKRVNRIASPRIF